MLTLMILVVAVGAKSARGQYLFLDANGDGLNSSLDLVKAEGWSLLDVWLVTDCNRDGTASIPARAGAPLGMFSYEFILHAENGMVEWGKYENLMPQFGFSFGTYQYRSDFYTGFAGTQAVPPGKYRLGRVAVRTTDGSPTIQFAAMSPLSPICHTSFGSPNLGRQEDNTIRFGDAVIPRGCSAPWADWYEADGSAPQSTAKTAKATERGPVIAFSVFRLGNGVSREPSLRIRTTTVGPLQVRVYDVRGRLMSTLVDEANAAPGTREVALVAKQFRPYLASGIIFYEVVTNEGTARGKAALLK